jgi:hypothetical protein
MRAYLADDEGIHSAENLTNALTSRLIKQQHTNTLNTSSLITPSLITSSLITSSLMSSQAAAESSSEPTAQELVQASTLLDTAASLKDKIAAMSAEEARRYEQEQNEVRPNTHLDQHD